MNGQNQRLSDRAEADFAACMSLEIRRKEARVFLIVGTIMLLSELWKQYCLTFVLHDGVYQWWYFPFQLCSVPMYLCLLLGVLNRKVSGQEIPSAQEMVSCKADESAESRTVLAVRAKNHLRLLLLRDALLAFLADFSLLSGAMAFCDTSGMYYDYAPLTVHSYAWHIGLVVLGFYAGTRRRRRDWRSFFAAAGIYLLCAGLAECFNLAFDRYGLINMFYINPHYNMGQVGFRELLAFLPNPAVIAVYLLATIFGAGCIHVIWMAGYGAAGQQQK